MFKFYNSDMVTGDSSSYNGVGILGLWPLHSVTVKKLKKKETKNPNTNSTNLHLFYFYFCKSGEHMAYLTSDFFFFASSLIHSSDLYLSMFH